MSHSKWSLTMVRALGICLLVFLSGCKEQILHDLNELRANQVRVILARNGIASDKVREGSSWSISVSSSIAAQALATLQEYRVVRPPRDIEEHSSNFLPSAEERRFIIERQTAEQLEDTIERLPDVLEARVHLNMKSLGLLDISGDDSSGSASVLVICQREDSKLEISRVKEIVAGAAGISRESVSVVIAAAPEILSEPVQSEEKINSAEYYLSLLPLEHSSTRVLYATIFGGLVAMFLIALRLRRPRTVSVPQSIVRLEKPVDESDPTPPTPKLSPEVF